MKREKKINRKKSKIWLFNNKLLFSILHTNQNICRKFYLIKKTWWWLQLYNRNIEIKMMSSTKFMIIQQVLLLFNGIFINIYIHLYPQLLALQYLNCILFNFFQITSSILTIFGPKVIKQIRNLKINTIQQKIYYKLKQLTNIRNHVVQKYWHLVKWNPLTVNSVTFVLDYFL